MAFEKMAAHNRGVEPGKLLCDLQTVLERIERILIDILRLDREPCLPDMLDPGGSAAAARGLVDPDQLAGVGQDGPCQCQCSAGKQKRASFHRSVLCFFVREFSWVVAQAGVNRRSGGIQL